MNFWFPGGHASNRASGPGHVLLDSELLDSGVLILLSYKVRLMRFCKSVALYLKYKNEISFQQILLLKIVI